MMRRLALSNRAEADFREIWRWSCARFGEVQADLYLERLGAGLDDCAREPCRGVPRHTIRPGYWSRLIQRHVAYYQFDDDEVLIQRVLHGSMNAGLHLPRPPSE